MGVRWRETPIKYYIDPDNPCYLKEEFICQAIYRAAEEWDDGVYSQLIHSAMGWRGLSMELFDDEYEVIHDANLDLDAPDGRNEILFGDHPQMGVVAVTVVWGYFSGPPSQRRIIEFDIMFDTDYIWGDADPDDDGFINDPFVMDLENIATHEFGHALGLEDYCDCDQETMYSLSAYGETMKRNLHYGDIEGVEKLYEN